MLRSSSSLTFPILSYKHFPSGFKHFHPIVKFLQLLKVVASTILLLNVACQRGVDGILGLTMTFQIAAIFLFFKLWVWFLVSEPTLARCSRVFSKIIFHLSSNAIGMGGLNQSPSGGFLPPSSPAQIGLTAEFNPLLPWPSQETECPNFHDSDIFPGPHQ